MGAIPLSFDRCSSPGSASATTPRCAQRTSVPSTLWAGELQHHRKIRALSILSLARQPFQPLRPPSSEEAAASKLRGASPQRTNNATIWSTTYGATAARPANPQRSNHSSAKTGAAHGDQGCICDKYTFVRRVEMRDPLPPGKGEKATLLEKPTKWCLAVLAGASPPPRSY